MEIFEIEMNFFKIKLFKIEMKIFLFKKSTVRSSARR